MLGAQVSICLVLLIAAGLLTRTSQRALEVDLGFNYRNILMLHVSSPATATGPAKVAALRYPYSVSSIVIGVAKDVRSLSLKGVDPTCIYFPVTLGRVATIVLRARGDEGRAVAAVQREFDTSRSDLEGEVLDSRTACFPRGRAWLGDHRSPGPVDGPSWDLRHRGLRRHAAPRRSVSDWLSGLSVRTRWDSY